MSQQSRESRFAVGNPDGAFLRRVICLLFVLGLLMVPGCGSCRNSNPNAQKSEEEKEKEKEEKPKENIKMSTSRLVPEDRSPTGIQVRGKPGHYVSVAQDITANNFDVRGRLATQSVDRDADPLGLPGSPFYLEGVRTSPLAKGTMKRVESVYFLPRMNGRGKRRIQLNSELISETGRRLEQRLTPTIPLPAAQYYMVVLGDQSERYAFLNSLDSLRPPWQITADERNHDYYHVILTKSDETQVSVPSYSFSWTGMAYVIWDKLDPKRLNERQRNSLLDWLHWGGQLIVVGPDSMNLLRGSFLEAYLPAKEVKTRNLTPEDFEDFNAGWSLKSSKGEIQLQLDPSQPPAGLDLELQNGGYFLNSTGKMVAESRVGRGRISVTAFSISERWFTSWKGIDNFFNACILRRPRRTFSNDEPFSRWTDYDVTARLDARLVTGLRYLTRDLGPLDQQQKLQLPGTANGTVDFAELSLRKDLLQDQIQRYGGYQQQEESGVAGWSDQNEVAVQARETLKQAAGVQVPTSSFVFKILAGYVLILVPLNWLLFRLIGRVELAWLAAPVIAVIGTIVVIRMAQLDIGFVRSRTEVAVLEVHADYNRAHLTRYTALYSSLTSTYSYQLDSGSAAAQPFSSTTDDGIDAAPKRLRQDWNQGLTLDGVVFSSNSTGMIQSQQMYDLDGTFGLERQGGDRLSVKNGTSLTLQDCGVIARGDDGGFSVAWIGKLDGNSSAPVTLKKSNSLWLKEWTESGAMKSYELIAADKMLELDRGADAVLTIVEAGVSPAVFDKYDDQRDGTWTQGELEHYLRDTSADELRLGQLVFAATQNLKLGYGEVRLIGRTDEEWSGLTVTPEARQTTTISLVLVHLSLPPLTTPLADTNAKIDFPVLLEDDPLIEELPSQPGVLAPGRPGNRRRRVPVPGNNRVPVPGNNRVPVPPTSPRR